MIIGDAMYSIKNEEDLNQILKYHRANDMVNLIKYFPDLSPIDDLAIITSIEDYEENKDKLSNLTNIRNGNPITQDCMKSIPVRDKNPDILKVLNEIKEENKDGVLILFHLNVDNTERYERYAGISVAVSLGRNIYIEAVGKGFDGREVLKGISCHERYSTPWDDILKVNFDNFKEYRTYLINQEEYLKTREERINYLSSCGIDRNILEENIPKEYIEIPDSIWEDVIKNVIKPLYREEEYLRENNYEEFNISGHTEGERFRPWQMVNSNRLG